MSEGQTAKVSYKNNGSVVHVKKPTRGSLTVDRRFALWGSPARLGILVLPYRTVELVRGLEHALQRLIGAALRFFLTLSAIIAHENTL
jgi:hypothetical protein